MSKLYLSFFAVIFCAQNITAQIPNSGFEFWTTTPEPIGWETNSRPLTLPPWDPYVVRKDTDSYSGNFAANFYANGQFKAFGKTTFAISNHPQSLSLWYKSSFPPCVNDNGFPETDTISVFVEILHNHAVVDIGYWESLTTSFSYSQLSIPITQNALLYDSCRITIYGGKVNGGCGIIVASTQFWVDALSLNYSSSVCVDSSIICPPGSLCCDAPLFEPVCGCDGVTYTNSCIASLFNGVLSWTEGECKITNSGRLNSTLNFSVGPVPVSGFLNTKFHLNENASVQVILKNLVGQDVVRSVPVKLQMGEQQVSLDVSLLSSGMYYLCLTVNSKTEAVKKIVVE
jgi:hypothetical protein